MRKFSSLLICLCKLIKREKNMNQTAVHTINRQDLACMTEITLEGEVTQLGEVRNFKSHPYLKTHIPEDISISWSALRSGESLKEHYHPCASVLIITEGQGRSTGDSQVDIKAGDVVYIPEWNLHGFIGKGENGFKALSIQFQETAIFESEENPETTYFDRESVPLEERQLQIITREELPSIHEAIVGGVHHNLGTLKNFSSNTLLQELFPSNFSCSWVKLENGQSLAPHRHQEDSMIILTEGKGCFAADKEFPLKKGDIVFVPEGANHGFKTEANQSFWALSVQFNPTGLYENQESPRVNFLSKFDQLIERNNQIAQDFYNNNHTFKISIDSLEKQNTLLDCLQVMSDHFQRLMYLRVGLCDSKAHGKVFMEHFLEELGHNKSLAKERKREKIWDPILESSCAWFVQRNYLLDNSERIIMVQMVLEKCAHLFYSHFANTLQEKSEHINSHMHADEGHDEMGLDLLRDEPDYKYERYFELQKESWSIMNLFIHRIGELL
ncbi:hypothetical protein BMS_0808 [Halobacteriovorax marinus SJ]|uniref:Cupin type-2 domain-containing protein n=2 Tax=Halobacteriovorax marinus TaxID=97084 RepID=E1X5Y8_HALMS|nr:hypothetical protein BMS_0808 [Halobacteriovorax marinus SJ]